MERRENLMMSTGLLRFDHVPDAERLRQLLDERLLNFPRFRERVVESPGGILPAHWEWDDEFDIHAHVHHVGLPSPGGDAALQELVSDLISTPLDFTRPRWQVHLVEDADGSGALVVRIHHCIADGIALMRLMFALTDETPTSGQHAHAAQAHHSGNGHTPLWLAALGETIEIAANPVHSAQAAVEGIRALTRLTLMPPDPETSLKGELGEIKHAAWSHSIGVDAVKKAARHFDGTINDVILGAVVGGLGRYLNRRGELVPGLEVRAGVPFNLRPIEQADDLGNGFSLVLLSLPLTIADPSERIAELKRRMDTIKHSPEPVLGLAMLGAIGSLPGPLQPGAIDFFGSKISLVVTNVPGPRQPLYLAGRRIRQTMFWAPESGPVGLGVSILSYDGHIIIGVVSDARLVSDPDELVQDIEAEMRASLRVPATATTP
jgi:diacylglycerol O-acyltransferase / wax synthase